MNWTVSEVQALVRRAAERLGPRHHPASERPGFVRALLSQYPFIDPPALAGGIREVWPAGTDLDLSPPTGPGLWAVAALVDGEPAPALQYARARRLAEAHGHQWVDAADFFARAFRGRRPSWADIARVSLQQNRENPVGGVIARPDDRGHICHTTATGRTSWEISPDGAVEIEISRPGEAPGRASVVVLRAFLASDGTLTVRAEPDATYCVRHVQALTQCLEGLWVTHVEEAVLPLYESAVDLQEALLEAEANLADQQEAQQMGARIEAEARAELLALARDGVEVELLPYAEAEPYTAQHYRAAQQTTERLRRAANEVIPRRQAAAAAAAEIDRWEDAAEMWGAT